MGKTDYKACYYATVMGSKKETFFLACCKYLSVTLQSQDGKPLQIQLRKSTLQVQNLSFSLVFLMMSCKKRKTHLCPNILVY